MAVVTPSDRLNVAKTKALAAGTDRVSRFYLNPYRKGIPGLDIADSIISARLTLTLEGASTIDVSVHDPKWLVEESGVLDTNSDGLMDAVDANIDSIVYRLAKAARRDPDTLSLTFEDRAVALLRLHKRPLAFSRGKYTRGQAIEQMVREVKAYDIPFFSPEKGRKQRIATPTYPEAAPSTGDSGFDKGASFKIKGQPADADQKRNVATAMAVCDQLDVTPRVRKAILVAGIGESRFSTEALGPEVPGQGQARGVWQLMPATERNLGYSYRDVEAGARTFLKTGFYKYGGAIKLARENGGMSVGEIASRVEGSATDGQNAGYYNAFGKEADAIIAAWNGETTNAADSSVLRVKQYQFRRGLPGRKESTWDAATRLAEEVGWRFYAAGGVTVFASDYYLIGKPASLVLDSAHDEMLQEPPTYDWDHGKLTAETTLRVSALRWSIRPAGVVYLAGRSFGPVKGRWLIHTVEQNMLDPTDCTVTLIKPVPQLDEPAPDILTVSRKNAEANQASAKAALTGKITSEGGAAGIVDQAAALATKVGGSTIYVGSAFRPGSVTTSGALSDHAGNDDGRAARDIGKRGVDLLAGPPSHELDRAAVAIGVALGRNYALGETIIDTFPWKGYRIQIIWRTPQYGGHQGHIHIGARKA